jgi:YaiO family outer membrane protein
MFVLLAAVAAPAQDPNPPAAPSPPATTSQDSDSSGTSVSNDKVAPQGRSLFGRWFGHGSGSSSDSAKAGKTVPQGSSIPGLFAPGFMDGPGYFEIGGSRSDLTAPIPSWTDVYFRGVLSPTDRDTFNLDFERQNRYDDSGWLYTLGVSHVFTDSLYVDVSGSTSTGGFFIPKYRVDAHVNVKALPRKQLILTGGVGLDQGKPINGFATKASRIEFGSTYYFTNWPLIVQDGVTFTHADPGGVTAPSGYLAITEGHYKEHYITVRAELGREGYQLFGSDSGKFTAFNFPIHNYSGTWRQWIGNNWGINASFERYVNPYFNRNGATVGLFLDF